ncbi:unnamed protein product [Notodromas monacha]|uniref:protein acetyllysine N-acetyltransferase n=1 Tax=Notodromas monacha TaxID=399045 RepID=A0A7R9GCU2_9CRUS|nr:unnamed protein product [Notodromas monacha]CAG0916455.1 unnamed protein product [Notodromas monacha]
MNDFYPCSPDNQPDMDPSDGSALPVLADTRRLPGFLGGTDQSLQSPCDSLEDTDPLVATCAPAGTVNSDDSSNDGLLLEALQDSDSVSSDSSAVSSLSQMSGKDWKPHAGPMSWIHRQMCLGANPRVILSQLLPRNSGIPIDVDDISLWKCIIEILTEPPRRHRLRHINNLEDVIRLIRSSRKMLILTGAGVSVSCGIPDFRSRNGLYARLAKDFPDLPDPQAMFDINYFDRDPRPFFKFAREIFPGQFEPSPAHQFIKLVEKHGKLLRNYTQNIDTLEQVAGIENVIQCHGSFATATCQRCQMKVNSDFVRDDIMAQLIPVCRACCPSGELDLDFSRPVSVVTEDFDETSSCSLEMLAAEERKNATPILKPDIVFFGEGLPEKFHASMASDKDECDLLIVIGSSLKVRPVALIPSSVPPTVPLVLINREPLHHLLGDCDVVCNELCRRLGDDWTAPGLDKPVLTALSSLPPRADSGFSGSDETQDCDEPKSEHDLEALRKCWQPKVKESVSDRLPVSPEEWWGGEPDRGLVCSLDVEI